jgi:hypothetical protein
VDTEAGTFSDPVEPSAPTEPSPAETSPTQSGSEPTPETTSAARRRRRWPWIAGLAVLGTVAVVVVALQPWAGSEHPSEWDSRVAPIAEDVARLRDLEFDHPVEVEFLGEDEFDERVTSDRATLSEEEEEEIEQINAFVRALGLGSGDVDLFDATNALGANNIAAFYDRETEHIVVNGDDIDVATEATIAHELVHVLQDQHFDLDALSDEADAADQGDGSALRVLVEGDAERIEEEYVAALSSADREEYEEITDERAEAAADENDEIPEFLEIFFGAPYALGPNTITLIVEEGGNAAVDDALSGPTPSARLLLEPGMLDGEAAPDPVIPDGVEPIGETGSFNAFDVYLMIAARADHYLALRAADAVAGGRYAMYRDGEDGPICAQVSLVADRARAHLIRGLEAWADAIPGASVDTDGDEISFSSCDPGESVDAPRPLEPAVTLLVFRHQLTIEALEADLGADYARCVARGFAQDQAVMDAILADPAADPSEEVRAAGRETVAEVSEGCFADEDAWLT